MISKFKITLVITATLLIGEAHGQNINTTLSKLFFNVDVSNLNVSLVESFSRDTTLRKSSVPNDTVFYPLKNNEAKYLIPHHFTFERNSYLKSRIIDGVLGVILGRDYNDKDFAVLFLAFEFENNIHMDSAFSELVLTFRELGALEIKSSPGDAAVITNLAYQKKVEILKFPSEDKFILYVYLKELKN